MKGIQLSLIVCAIVSTSCVQIVAPTAAHKISAYRALRNDWKLSGTPLEYGKSRSVMVFAEGTLKIPRNDSGSVTRFTIKGNSGLVTIISSDGYALTAGHCLSRKKQNLTIGSKHPNYQYFRPHVTKGLASQTLKDIRPHASMTGGRIVSYPRQSYRGISSPDFRQTLSTIQTLPARVVYRFPNRDLALIKLPIKNALFFPLDGKLDGKTTYFTSSSSSTKAPYPSAGTLISRGYRSTALLHLPQVPGDSGGPVFSPTGKLIGIVAQITPHTRMSDRHFTGTIIEIPKTREIKRLIQKDRGKQNQ